MPTFSCCINYPTQRAFCAFVSTHRLPRSVQSNSHEDTMPVQKPPPLPRPLPFFPSIVFAKVSANTARSHLPISGIISRCSCHALAFAPEFTQFVHVSFDPNCWKASVSAGCELCGSITLYPLRTFCESLVSGECMHHLCDENKKLLAWVHEQTGRFARGCL